MVKARFYEYLSQQEKHIIRSYFKYSNEEFHHKMGYIHFCQFEIFAIEAAKI